MLKTDARNEPRRRGRTPTFSPSERRRRILAAAEDVFTAKGYSTASMDDIVRSSGMSKKTVYQTFDTKEQLFTELVASAIDDAPELRMLGNDRQSREACLRDGLQGMADFILSPRQIALARLVLSESPTAPELGAIFHEKVIVTGQSRLADAIRQLGQGEATSQHRSEQLADFLIGGLIGHEVFAILIGRSPPPKPTEISQKIDALLDLFRPALGLAGCDATQSPARDRAR